MRGQTARWTALLVLAGLLCGPAVANDAELVAARLSLPPLTATRQVIAALPQVQAVRAGLAVAQARDQQLAAGPHEWSLKLGTQRRSETSGAHYAENEWALERGIRWGGKAQADRDLGAAGLLVGQQAYADAWHEAVRDLIRHWYDWQREHHASQLLGQQVVLAQEQLRVAVQRVRAGDAPGMDQLMAQAEHDRAQAALQQVQGRAQWLQQALQKRFPGLVVDLVQAATEPPPALQEEPQDWLRRIIDDNHEIELAQAELRQAQLQAERARLNSRPDPTLGVRSARERGGLDEVLGVYLSLPLPGAYRAAEEGVALAQAAAAEQRLQQTRQRVETEAQRVVQQASQTRIIWQRLHGVAQSMDRVAQLAVKAYGLGEMTLTEALQARRAALDAALAAEAARWDAREALARLLVDAHQLWAADEHGH